MKKMKKLSIYIIGMAVSLSACDFLETDTFDELSESNVYNNLESCEAGLAGVYDPLSSTKLYGGNLIMDCDGGSDIMIYNKQYSIGMTKVYLNNYTPVDKTLDETWTELYKGINRANTYIDAIKDKPLEAFGDDERTKQRLLAEAKGLRALYYMNLVSLWGEVPLRLTPTTDLSSQKLARSPQIDIYNQIIADLQEAEKGCLPADELGGPGHMSQTTAQALLARAYLWMSGYPVYADKWNEALTYARKVRDSELHELVQTRTGELYQRFENGVLKEDNTNGYRVLFIDMCSDQYNWKESMFEAEMYSNDLNITRESASIGLSNGITQGSGLDPENGFCYGFWNGSRILFRMYEDDDQRKWWNFSTYTFNRTVISENEEKATKKYRTDKELDESVKEGDAAKWRREYEVVRPVTQYSTSINCPIMRYSDVLLMLAEAANEVEGAPTQEAIDAVNEVRRRAGASEVNLGDYNADTFREFIRDERARELCYEGNRKMDLRRWGKDYFMKRIRMLADQNTVADESKYDKDMVGYPVAVSGEYAGTNIKAQPGIQLEDKHIYFPIPEAELNTNPICGQNEGW